MNWHYAADGKPLGPFTEEHFQHLVHSGVITADTLVWREGMSGWQRYSEAFPSQGAVAPPPGAACSGCGQWHVQDAMIQYEGKWICAACKPMFVQRLKEGAPLIAAAGPTVGESAILQREFQIDIGECLTRAWKLFSTQPGLIIGATALSGLVFLGLWIVSMIIGFVIPLGGQVIMMICSGPLIGGLLWFYLRLARGEPAEVADIFAGFRRQFTQLFLASLIQGLINLACMIPFGIAMLLVFLAPMAVRHNPGPAMITGFIIAMVLGLLVAVAALLYLATIWTFSLMLIVDKGYRFWPAMQFSRRFVMKRFWMMLAFLLVAGIIMSAGMFACFIGMLVTVPLYYAMKVFLYEDNFRDLAPPST
ncbi:MAG: DUF4339 domain-containing protein [Verrucomicrobia bacterium]|nr:DUF4339 domain-containing protein [Verrucomicrobiota bacterium]